MIARLRVLVLLCRPPVLVLLGLFVATGLAQAGHPTEYLLLARALGITAGFLLFSVALNDLADERIDRVNLPGDARRPLVAGTAGRRELLIAGLTAGAAAVVAAGTIGWAAVLVLLAGLGCSAAYSVHPVRLADRGAVASLVLPACYVAVPYLIGVLSGRPRVSVSDLLLLGGLYLGFVGRILLKDFRDVRGDELFGKRTFLVRHGRVATCRLSAAFWTVGGLALVLATRHPTGIFVASTLGGTLAAVALLRALAASTQHRRDELLISTLAVIGRGIILVLLAHLSLQGIRGRWRSSWRPRSPC